MDTLSYCHLKRVVRDIKFSRTSCQGQKLTLYEYTKRNSDKITVCVLIGLQKRTHQCLQLLFLQIPSNSTFIPSPHPFHPSQSFKSRLTNMAPSLPLHLPPTPCARRQHLRRLVLRRRRQSDSHRLATGSSTPSQRPKRPSMIFEARFADFGATVYATV